MVQQLLIRSHIDLHDMLSKVFVIDSSILKRLLLLMLVFLLQLLFLPYNSVQLFFALMLLPCSIMGQSAVILAGHSSEEASLEVMSVSAGMIFAR